MKTTIAALLAATLLSAPSAAAILTFEGALSGDQEVVTPPAPPVVTEASGFASFTVDTSTRMLAFDLSVEGLSLDDLFDTLVAAPIGPIHLHNAPAGANGPIVIPFPFGATYMDTASGFTVSVTGLAFSDAVALAGSDLTFSAFLDELRAGNFYANVHTDAFPSGELRGQLARVPAPGALGLLGLAALGMVGLRRGR